MKAIVQESYEGVDGLKLKEMAESKRSPLLVTIRNKFIPVLPYDWETEYGMLKTIRPVVIVALVAALIVTIHKR